MFTAKYFFKLHTSRSDNHVLSPFENIIISPIIKEDSAECMLIKLFCPGFDLECPSRYSFYLKMGRFSFQISVGITSIINGESR
jgi:hypothetical protein